jgi:IclR family transcriptional regulator, mhp operon transcriptional activator
MTGTETIRGLERGLQVLQFLQTHPIASLGQLHAGTKLSKPSLLRILYTLERNGLVARRLGDGCYRLSARLTRMAPRRARYDRVAEAAAPVLDHLCREISWPSDLLVPAGDHMQIAETSQTQSPFLIRVSRIGQPVCWLLGAVGRIYLAYCPEAEREAILKRLRKSEALEDRLARDSRRLDRILAETRQRGYGTRDTSFGGGAYKGPPVDDGLAAIAVALVGRNRVYGSINILFTRSASTVEAFADRHLLHLRDAAAEIVSALEVARSGGRRPK